MSVIQNYTQPETVISYNGKPLTVKYNGVKQTDFNILPERILEEVIVEPEPLEPDCS